VRLTQVPTAGEMAHRAGDVGRADQAPQGLEQHVGCLQDPLMVNRRFLKKPARIDALGLVFWWALLSGRLRERARRLHVETPGHIFPGGDQPETTSPTAVMMRTTVATIRRLHVGAPRQVAQVLSAVPQP
jgi:hypothetical protein